VTSENAQPTRYLSFEQIATTEDTGDPVIRAEFEDTESYVNAVICNDRETIRVTHVKSFYDGDMSRILDAMTRQLDTTDVRFMIPLGSDLRNHLHGYEKTTEKHVDPNGGIVEVEVLVGNWEPSEYDE